MVVFTSEYYTGDSGGGGGDGIDDVYAGDSGAEWDAGDSGGGGDGIDAVAVSVLSSFCIYDANSC